MATRPVTASSPVSTSLNWKAVLSCYLVTAAVLVWAKAVFLLTPPPVLPWAIVAIPSRPAFAAGLLANGGAGRQPQSQFKQPVEFRNIDSPAELARLFARKDGPPIIGWASVASLPLLRSMAKDADLRAFMLVDWSSANDSLFVPSNVLLRNLDSTVRLPRFGPSTALYECLKCSLNDKGKTFVARYEDDPPGVWSAASAANAGNSAFVLWGPTMALAAATMSEPAYAKPMVADVLVAPREFLDKQGSQVAAFAEVWLTRGLVQTVNNTGEAARMLRESTSFIAMQPGDVTKIVEKSADRGHWSEENAVQQNRRMFGTFGTPAIFDVLYSRADKSELPEEARKDTLSAWLEKYAGMHSLESTVAPSGVCEREEGRWDETEIRFLKDDTFNEDGPRVLKEWAKKFSEIGPGKMVVCVVGHADSASPGYNPLVSKRRAKAVKEYLRSQGLRHPVLTGNRILPADGKRAVVFAMCTN
jgi:outer membrane protein OmpA-like peptidoglycan-associated protein